MGPIYPFELDQAYIELTTCQKRKTEALAT
jgi:hypothetical protein